VVKCGNRKYKISYYNGWLRDFICSANGCMGKLFGIIDLLIRDDGVLLRMPDGVLMGLFNAYNVVETWIYDIHFLAFDMNG